jgi:hypothetical protein
MDVSYPNFAILKLVANNQYSFGLTYLDVNSATNSIGYCGDCCYYLILVFPIKDNDQVNDDYECYSFITKETTDQYVYGLYKIKYLSNDNHRMLLTQTESIKIASAIHIIGCAVFFESNQLERFSNEFNVVSCLTLNGNQHAINLVNADPLSGIFFDRLPAKAIIRLNGYQRTFASSYENDHWLLVFAFLLERFWS